MLTLHVSNPSEHVRPETEPRTCEYVFVPWPRIAKADPALTPRTVAARTAGGAPVPCDVVLRGAAEQVLALRIDQALPPGGAAPLVVEVGPWGRGADDEGPLSLEFEHRQPPEAEKAETGEGETGEAESGEAESGEAELGKVETGEVETGEGESGEAESGEAGAGEAGAGGAVDSGDLESVCRVRMVNELLNVWFDLGDHFGKQWFAGAASSVQLRALEVLDDHRKDPNKHDPEKRCMQIDLVTISYPGWECPAAQERRLYASPYTLVDYASGPIGVSVTIASPTAEYGFYDPFVERHRKLECTLFRRLSLYGGVNYVEEEVWMHGETEELDHPLDLCFTARYFSYMEMGSEPFVSRFLERPGWRAISMPHDPQQGYGFATDAPTGDVENPHPEYPDHTREHRTFSWEVGACKGYRCVHLFHRSEPDRLMHETERAWTELLSEPLRVEIVP
jgi:hypothetical protein